jgi:hypothetical protein
MSKVDHRSTIGQQNKRAIILSYAPLSIPDHAARRAGIYRHRAKQLAEAAAHEWRDQGRRLHLLDLAKSYERTADAMAPLPSPREQLIEHLKTLS